MIYEFRFWTEWCDDKGRFWAEPWVFDAAAEARRSHKGALGWHWAAGKVRPSVSDLYSIAYSEDPATGKKREENRTVIQDGAMREFHEATLSGLRSADDGKQVPGASSTPRPGTKPDSFDTPF